MKRSHQPAAPSRQEGVRASVGDIAGVEGLRGVAVLLVVFFHYAIVLDPRFADPWMALVDSAIVTKVVVRILRRLDALEQAGEPGDMNMPGFDFHALSGKRAGTYTVHVNGPWCITVRWDGADAIDVDLENYH